MNADQAVSASRHSRSSIMLSLASLVLRASVAMSAPLDLGSEAASGGIVRMDPINGRICKEASDDRVRLARPSELSINHHALRIETAQRKNSTHEHGRDLVNKLRCLERPLRDEDRVACPIGVWNIMADVIDEQHAFPWVAILERYSAWKARL